MTTHTASASVTMARPNETAEMAIDFGILFYLFIALAVFGVILMAVKFIHAVKQATDRSHIDIGEENCNGENYPELAEKLKDAPDLKKAVYQMIEGEQFYQDNPRTLPTLLYTIPQPEKDLCCLGWMDFAEATISRGVCVERRGD